MPAQARLDALRAIRDSYARLVAAIGISSLTAERYAEACAVIQAASQAIAMADDPAPPPPAQPTQPPAPMRVSAPFPPSPPKRTPSRQIPKMISAPAPPGENLQQRFRRRLHDKAPDTVADEAAAAAAMFADVMRKP